MESPVSDASADEERGLRNNERRKSGLLASRSLQSRRRSSQSTNPDVTRPERGESSGDDTDEADDKNKPGDQTPSSGGNNNANNAAGGGGGARAVIGDLFSPLTKLRKNIGLETRAEKKEREADEETAGTGKSNLAATSVSALTQDVLDRTGKIRQQMRTMMDRSKGAGSTQAGEGGNKPQSEEESEGDTSPNKTKGVRSTTTGFRRTKERNNKENAGDLLGGSQARDAGEDGDTVDKLTSRLKRRGLNRRSSREEKGGDSDSDGSNGGGGGRQPPSRDHIDADHRYMRRASPSQLRTRRQLLDRVVAEQAPEMHIIGEVSYGTGFGTGVSCRWILEIGKFWSHLAGDQYGQTHTVYTLPEDGDAGMATWNHPLDIHLTTTSIQGWPRILVQVSNLDEFGRTSIVGYGFQHVPLVPGPNKMEITCWRPTGAMQDELAAYFLGVTPQLVDNDVVFTKAWDKRCRLVTLPSGRVNLQVNVILRHFAEHDVDIA